MDRKTGWQMLPNVLSSGLVNVHDRYIHTYIDTYIFIHELSFAPFCHQILQVYVYDNVTYGPSHYRHVRVSFGTLGGGKAMKPILPMIFINREAREIIHLVASVCLSVCLQTFSRLNKSHYQSKAFLCVSVIRGHIRIIVQMRSIGFWFYCHLAQTHKLPILVWKNWIACSIIHIHCHISPWDDVM